MNEWMNEWMAESQNGNLFLFEQIQNKLFQNIFSINHCICNMLVTEHNKCLYIIKLAFVQTCSLGIVTEFNGIVTADPNA